ncbi:WbqC family protein [Streptomyces sp. NBC_00154]|nr:WbqC family protein [Streptomyces sp. NBC_00154]
MPRTSLSSAPDSPAGSLPHDVPPPRGLCAVHQPNFLPRLSTLAKLFAADCWIVLDDVQFTRRDYQHRARLASTSHPDRHQWLSIPTHLPHGRSTVIRDAVLVDPERSRRRVMHMLAQQYGSCPEWPVLRHEPDSALVQFRQSDKTADVAEASTRMLLNLVGWEGRILYSSQQPAASSQQPAASSRQPAAGPFGAVTATRRPRGGRRGTWIPLRHRRHALPRGSPVRGPRDIRGSLPYASARYVGWRARGKRRAPSHDLGHPGRNRGTACRRLPTPRSPIGKLARWMRSVSRRPGFANLTTP